jgi:haloacetate dehalogenase
MFDGFATETIPTPRGTLHARVGGSGPPLLLLHGWPQTHHMWHAAAPALAKRFTVVATDLPGYGASFRPQPSADHDAHSKRALAADHVAAMAHLGFSTFAVAGHDRGGRVAVRLALDHPAVVTRMAALDIVPTGEIWRAADANFALGYWHWSFLAQPAPLPERMILGAPEAMWGFAERLGLGAREGRYPAEVLAVYRAQLEDPATVEAMCEDYRAGASVDREHDDADRGVREIACPVRVLWGATGALPRFYGDPLELWRAVAPGASGRTVEATHFMVEDVPEEIASDILAFLGGGA